MYQTCLTTDGPFKAAWRSAPHMQSSFALADRYAKGLQYNYRLVPGGFSHAFWA